MSFAKYLDLRFHAGVYRRSASSSCIHSLHWDHIQFFAFGHAVATFKLSRIKVREICSPSLIIPFSPYQSLPDRHELIEMVKVCAIKGHNVFATIADYLNNYQTLELEKLEEKVTPLVGSCRTEKQLFRDRLECLQVRNKPRHLLSTELKFSQLVSC